MISKFLSLLLLSGLIIPNGANIDRVPPPPPVETAEAASADSAPERITPSEDIDLTGMEVFWQSEEFFLEADEAAIISIYAEAEKDANGELIFDDGQEWMLLMETPAGNYPLFPRRYVQLGEVRADVFWDSDGTFHVQVSVKQGAGILIYDCVYHEGENEFITENVYDEQGINLISQSPHIS